MAQEDGGRQLLGLAAERLLQADARKAASSSNYDYVKIKVRLGTHLEHYYILSRFLLSRMLTVITLPQHKVRSLAAHCGCSLAATSPMFFCVLCCFALC